MKDSGHDKEDRTAKISDKFIHLKTIADTLPHLVWTANPNGDIDYYNQRWLDYTGTSLEETQGWGGESILHPDDLQNCIDKWQHALHSGGHYEVEYRLKRASDNSYRWHLGRALPIKDESNEIVKWFGTSTDIDDQKKAHEKLANDYLEVEKLIADRTTEISSINKKLTKEIAARQKILEKMHQDSLRLNEIIITQALLAQSELNVENFMALVVDHIADLTHASGAAIEMLEGNNLVLQAASGILSAHVGLKFNIPKNLSGLAVLQNEVINSDNYSHLNSEIEKEAGVVSAVVSPLINLGKPIGVLKIVSNKKHVFKEAEVQILKLMAGLVGAALDHKLSFENYQRLLLEKTESLNEVTKEIAFRKKIEKEIIINERRISLILENSYDAFIGINEDSKIIAWNAQAEKTFGWTKKEVRGKDLGNLIIPDRYRDMHNAGVKRFIATGKGPRLNTRLQLEAINSEQIEFPIELTVGAVKLTDKYEFFAFIHDITDRRKSENNLRRLSHTDFLTQAGNRAVFLTSLQNAIQQFKQSRKLIALLFIDLDYFKKINDTHGHLIGDKVLQQFVIIIKKHLKENDTIARLGGDEFAIILEVGSKTNALEKWIKSLQKSLVGVTVDQRLSLTISISVGVVFLSEELNEIEKIMSLADTCLYEAKKAGRNQFFISN